MPAPRQVARFPALPQAASSFSSPASTPLGLLHCRRSAGLPADPRARFGQPDPDGWRSSRRRGGGAPFAVRRSCPSRQDGVAKTVSPRRCRQDGAAKTGSPRRGRQDGVAKTVSPRRCRQDGARRRGSLHHQQSTRFHPGDRRDPGHEERSRSPIRRADPPRRSWPGAGYDPLVPRGLAGARGSRRDKLWRMFDRRPGRRARRPLPSAARPLRRA